MATTSKNTRSNSAKKNTSTKKPASTARKSTRSTTSRKTTVPRSVREPAHTSSSIDPTLKRDLIFWGMLVVSVVLFLCLIGTIKGVVGPLIKSFILGVFGTLGYIMPFLIFIATWLIVANRKSLSNMVKISSGIAFIVLLGVFMGLVSPSDIKEIAASDAIIKSLYEVKEGVCGGVIFGGIAALLVKLISQPGAIVLDILLLILCGFMISGKSVIDFVNGIADKAMNGDFDEEEDGQKVLNLPGKKLEALVDKSYSDSKEKMKAINEQRQKNKEEYEEKRQAEKEAKAKKEAERAKEKERVEDERIVNSNRFNMENMVVAGNKVKPETNDDVHSISIIPGTTEELTNLQGQLESVAPNQKSYHAVGKHQAIEEVMPAEFGDPTDNMPKPTPVVSKAPINAPKPSEVKPESKNEFNPVINRPEPIVSGMDTGELPQVKKETSVSVNPIITPVVNKTENAAVSELSKTANYKNADGSTHVAQINDTPMDIPESVTKGVSIKPYDTMPGGPDLRITSMPEPVTEKSHKTATAVNAEALDSQIKKVVHKRSDYKAPDINLLKRNDKKGEGDSSNYLKETALKLQDTLKVFGVGASVTDISQGPSVTRYELSLDTGVKVNKILNLQEDLKLNMAAEDIRIEAPIPGKAAVGIELPNKEATPVLIRDLVDSPDFKASKSNLTFGIGKDISGKTIIGDIAKMPHMLIAGSTGSGKSVCINTIIMSILYKAHPDDVKLIMVDPKVVELSVYNGIPHLMIPVVTDPKKASAALAWAVAEMTKRYNSFAEYGVRDLAGFNEKVEALKKDNPEAPDKLPQIVVIVDELADLMMVASKEVEESICRLAQLARAAGIHLIIATQRPSADVITGLIKANMPSKIAFRVASGIDSRIILDSVGAERLLGKGDMLYYPQGFSKPLRVQGCFVSDKEVTEVVDFLVKNNSGYSTENIEVSKITEYSKSDASDSSDGGKDSENLVDEYFADACRAVIKKGTASSGNLQRMFRIGFNRAARMIDQMESMGIVGPEQGTKPRQVLVSEMELEQILASLK